MCAAELLADGFVECHQRRQRVFILKPIAFIAIGLFVGILPGIGGTTALILLTPLTFALEPVQALALAGGIMGAVPMALGTGLGSELRRPLGITIIGGLVVSQVLTLYTTPRPRFRSAPISCEPLPSGSRRWSSA